MFERETVCNIIIMMTTPTSGTNYRTRGEHANHYAIDAVCKCYQVGSLMTLPLPVNPNIQRL
jgi:hypothetical protein